jgi:hypothetical protein
MHLLSVAHRVGGVIVDRYFVVAIVAVHDHAGRGRGRRWVKVAGVGGR